MLFVEDQLSYFSRIPVNNQSVMENLREMRWRLFFSTFVVCFSSERETEKNKPLQTRKHSTRMRIARSLPTIRPSVSIRCQHQGRISSERVWTGLQWCPPDVTSTGIGPQVWCLGGGRLSYHVTYPMMHVICLPPCEQTDVCENITFWQLGRRAVRMSDFGMRFDFPWNASMNNLLGI